MNSVLLFCLPNAGGLATMYNPWKALLEPSIQLVPIELAGKGRRFTEPLYDTMHEAVEDIYRLIEPKLATNAKFAFFGHSMGAFLCYELIHKIWQSCGVAPIHAFLSGRTPPKVSVGRQLHTLTDHELQEEVLIWGGIPEPLVADQIFMQMLLPILRADLRIIEIYNQHYKEYHPLHCPISVLTGMNDSVAPAQMMSTWKDCTTQSCAFYTFEGDHFYLLPRMKEVIQLINGTLA